jgi:hypothetical protein
MAILSFDGGCGGGSVKFSCPFTTDVSTLLAAIDGLGPGGGTPMYIAVGVATDYASKKGQGKQSVVILMSDGGDTCRDQMAKAAADIRASNIPVAQSFETCSRRGCSGNLDQFSARRLRNGGAEAAGGLQAALSLASPKCRKPEAVSNLIALNITLGEETGAGRLDTLNAPHRYRVRSIAT